MIAFGKINDDNILDLTVNSNDITNIISFNPDDAEQLCKNLLLQIYERKKYNLSVNNPDDIDGYYEIKKRIDLINSL
jgi:hypothetical protein